MELDFGGIGKEYAADRAAAVLAQSGVEYALVNLGGDVRVVGPQADGAPWRIGIRHPREPNRVLATIALSEGALATSGDYERFFELEGKRYCHILDPRAGRPVDTFQSVSVVAPLCVVAGSCATIENRQFNGPGRVSSAAWSWSISVFAVSVFAVQSTRDCAFCRSPARNSRTGPRPDPGIPRSLQRPPMRTQREGGVVPH
jgi:hypothetical protein